MCDVGNLQLNQKQLLLEIASLLETTSTPSDANALVLNQELQRHLEQIRDKIHLLLKSVRARYARNEEILVRRLKPRSRRDDQICQSGALLRGGTFHFKGNLYFRDADGRSCPNNEDYERRCREEMFPTDFDMRSKHVWTVLDKKNVLMGVKQQLLDYATYRNQSKSQNVLKRKAVDQHTKSLVSLLASVDKNFSIDWNQISTIDVGYRHSSYSCEAMWRVYLDPKLRRDKWSDEEDEILVMAARTNQMQNWLEIASSLNGRSDYQCFVRVQTTLRSSIYASSPTSSGGVVKWSEEENERLKNLVEKNTVNGQINWTQVMEYFPDKSKSTIIGRYTYVLHPSISHEPFSAKEDMMLFAAVEEYGGKFHCFPRSLFPNRSLTQLRTRYHNVLAQRNKTDSWSELDDTKLMDFVTEHGAAQWVNCAAFLGNHTRTSCRTRFLVIKRFLERNPSATVQNFPRRKKTKDSRVTAENWAQRLQEWHDDPDSLQPDQTKSSKSKSNKPKKVKVEETLVSSYMRSLKGVDLQAYNYFKYSYNLKLNEPAAPISLPRNPMNLELVAKSLAYKQPAPNLFKPIQSPAIPKQLSQCYNSMLFQLKTNNSDNSLSDSVLLPPNWSTMMAFRAMCILSGHCRTQSEDTTDLTYDESIPAIQLFRQRLRALFYRTTLLSRLEVEIFKDLPTALMAHPRPPLNQSSVVLQESPKEQALPKQPQPPPSVKRKNPLNQQDAKKLASHQMKEVQRLIDKQKKCKLEPMSDDEMKQEFLSEDDGDADAT